LSQRARKLVGVGRQVTTVAVPARCLPAHAHEVSATGCKSGFWQSGQLRGAGTATNLVNAFGFGALPGRVASGAPRLFRWAEGRYDDAAAALLQPLTGGGAGRAVEPAVADCPIRPVWSAAAFAQLL